MSRLPPVLLNLESGRNARCSVVTTPSAEFVRNLAFDLSSRRIIEAGEVDLIDEPHFPRPQ